MPEKITLADGTEKEVLTDEEKKELVSRSETRKEQREEFKLKLKDTEDKLSKLENKDFNFKKLRDMKEDEKAKLTATELQLKKQQETIEENQEKFQDTIIDSYKNEALAVIAGNDKELRKKVLYNYDRIIGETITKEQINSKMREAANMLGSNAPIINPINSAMSQSGYPPVASKGDKKVDGGLAKNLGITQEELDKKGLKTN